MAKQHPFIKQVSWHSAGRVAYKADVAANPVYHDGAPRKTWEQLDQPERDTWERNPTPRATA